jgi:hypothetical protein
VREHQLAFLIQTNYFGIDYCILNRQLRYLRSQAWRKIYRHFASGEGVNSGYGRGPEGNSCGCDGGLVGSAPGQFGVDGRSSTSSYESFLMSALGVAEKILEVIDRKYPGPKS